MEEPGWRRKSVPLALLLSFLLKRVEAVSSDGNGGRAVVGGDQWVSSWPFLNCRLALHCK